MAFPKILHKKFKRIASLVALVLVFIGIKIGIDFTLAPKKEKECDYIYPNFFEDTQPTKITLERQEAPFTFAQEGGTINDASCLNKTSVYGIAEITSEGDVKNALEYAKQNDLEVTSAGMRHSMGGQAFVPGGLVLDMRGLKDMKLDIETQTLRVQTGARWSEVQEYLDAQGFSVQAMQSINIFTVGGTVSVNAHGVAHDPGQIAPTVKSMRIMNAKGEIVEASPQKNSELFSHALGGYGLFGVILDVDLEVVPNEVYRWSTDYIDYKDFPEFYANNIDNNEEMGLMYGRISLSPTSYLTKTAVHTFRKTDWNEPVPKLKSASLSNLSRFVMNLSKTGGFGRWVRWMLEVNVENRFHNCVSRNNMMSGPEVCDVSRNQEMYDPMSYLKNRLQDTDILHEYFIPPNRMVEFIDGLRTIVKENDANLLNVTIRIVHEDTITALPYARGGDRFAFVLYFNQKFNDKESEILKKTTQDLIDLTNGLGGTFYLPYQLYYTQDQLRTSYPGIDSFFETKRIYDPEEIFTNKWYKKYSNE